MVRNNNSFTLLLLSTIVIVMTEKELTYCVISFSLYRDFNLIKKLKFVEIWGIVSQQWEGVHEQNFALYIYI